MATEVTLPALGESVTEGTVTRWLKQVGDSVAVDEALLEVSTDKVDTEIPSPVAGTLLEIKANEDETVEVGAVLAVIGDEGESAGSDGGGGESEAAEDEGDTQAEASAESGSAEETPAEEDTQEEEQQPEEPEQPAAQEEQSSGGGGGGGKTTSVTLPALGESVTEGTVTRWLKQVGDAVAVDEALLEVSTDKVDTEIPSPVAGTLLEIKVNEDETVEVGAELAVIGDEGAARRRRLRWRRSPSSSRSSRSPSRSRSPRSRSPSPRSEPEPEAAPQEEEQEEKAPEPAAAPEQPAAQQAPTGRDEPSGYVTPLVRKMATQHGVDLAAVTGTGVGGRIRKQDVLDAAAKQGTTAAPSTAAAEAAASQPRRPLPRPRRQHRPRHPRPPPRRPRRRRCAARPRR